jgi:hypothetical protein
VECVWGYVKASRLANFVPRHVRHLDRVVTGHLGEIRSQPGLIKALWSGSKLPFPRLDIT